MSGNDLAAFLLFSAAYAAEQERANGGPSTSATVPSQEPAAAPKKTKKKSSSKRAAAAVDQNDDDDDGGDESERPPPPIKRRNTTTSMSAAAIEESLKMAKEEEDRRKEATESGGGEAAGGGAAEGRAEKVHATDPQSEAQKATTNALELEGDHQQTATGASATKEQDTRDAAAEDDSAGQEGATSTIGAQDEKAAATTDKDTDHGAAQEDEEMADAATAPGSPPTLRRSSRKPVPAGTGTSLAKTHRDTRPSPSPTPSHGSDGEDDEEEEEDDRFRFRPILADIDAAKDVLADRAARHWCETLAAGGGHTVQGPGVNPALAGQVMMGANAGGIMREGEAISEFLYAARLKGEHAGWGRVAKAAKSVFSDVVSYWSSGSALKIYKDNAALYGQTPAGAYQAYP